MGRNARLQNEIRAHHIRMNAYGSDQLEAIGDFTAILDSVRTQTKAAMRELDIMCHEHPTLSERYRTYYRNSILTNGMSNLMRAKFMAPNYELPEAYMKAVEEEYWQKLAEPYTLEAYTFTYFFNDYSEQLQQKAQLSHCQEEYERLKDYDVVYLYLANRSSDQGWKNVVKEYQVAGKNVVHYNLPEHQQKAVEEYLGVQGFPTNIVFGRDGKLHKVLDFPLDIEAVTGVLEKM